MTCAPLHLARVKGGLWFLKYCKKVFQSRRFCDSYRLGGAGDELGSAAGADDPAADGPSPLFGSDATAPDAESIFKIFGSF